MQPDKIVLEFRHFSGCRCVITMLCVGPRVDSTISLRHRATVGAALNEQYLDEWNAWLDLMVQMPDKHPPLPPGWR